MGGQVLIVNCDTGESFEINLFSPKPLSPNWAYNAGKISIAEINYCPPGAVINFYNAGSEVYFYTTQGLADSRVSHPVCSLSSNPDGSSYSGPVDSIIADVSAMAHPINISLDSHPGEYHDWSLELSLTHDSDSNTYIFYTTDGTDPVTSPSRQTYALLDRPILAGSDLANNGLVFFKARAINTVLGQGSGLISGLYVFRRPISLIASVPHGYHIDKTPITLSASYVGLTPEIYYTTDGSEVLYSNGLPTTEAMIYKDPIIPQFSEFRLKAVAIQEHLTEKHFSNFVNNFYRYEEDVLILEASPAGGVFPLEDPQGSLLIVLTTSNPNALIKYTLDGSSPLCSSAFTYTGAISLNLPNKQHHTEYHLRAVAITTRLISVPIDTSFIIYDKLSDADGDGMSSFVEGGPGADTDGDSIWDMYDTDSDNDGMPDAIEGPEYATDPNVGPRFWYDITWPESPLINGRQYEIKIMSYKRVDADITGIFDIYTENKNIIFSEITGVLTPGIEKIIYAYVPERMDGKCIILWPPEPFEISVTVSHTDDETGAFVSFVNSKSFEIVFSNEANPYEGNLITWQKIPGSRFYGIYRKNQSDPEFIRIARILHDSFHTYETQQYLDRDGELLSLYRISAFDNESESGWSNVLHAADCGLKTCCITGHVSDISGNPKANIRISVRIDKPVYNQRNTFVDAYEKHIYSDALGQFVLELPRLSECLLRIDQAGLRQKIVIPNRDFIALNDLLKLNITGETTCNRSLVCN